MFAIVIDVVSYILKYTLFLSLTKFKHHIIYLIHYK